jgi:hypothetical protein
MISDMIVGMPEVLVARPQKHREPMPPKRGDTVIVREEILDPSSFLDIVRHDPDAIKSSRVIAPRFGDAAFGSVLVEYKMPRVRRRP